MLLNVIAFISLAIASPELEIKMGPAPAQNLSLQVEGRDDLLDRCMQSALELRFRYRLKVCRKRTLWFDECKNEKVVTRSVIFDPISESYKVMLDVLGDKIPPTAVTLTSRDDALSELSVLPNINLAELEREEPAFPEGARTYLRARVESECKGSTSEALSHISSFLTLGLVKIAGFDSGWIDFNWNEQGR